MFDGILDQDGYIHQSALVGDVEYEKRLAILES